MKPISDRPVAHKQARNDSLAALYEDMRLENLAPTWRDVQQFMTSEPRASYRPWLWEWDAVMALLARAGDLVTLAVGSERRSMEHVNPDLTATYSATHTLATAVQLVKAGERAPLHRHSAAAVRFVAKSDGGNVFTSVEGERLRMEENDLILTPAGAWHEHVNESNSDIIWFDVLDFPLVNLLQASYFESAGEALPPPRAEGFSARRLGNYRPAGWQSYPHAFSVMRYPWSEMKRALLAERDEAGSPYDGICLEYIDPATGGSTLPTISCRAQLLPCGRRLQARRTSSSSVYLVLAGSGCTIVNGLRFDWKKGDVLAIPIWSWYEHIVGPEDALLFSATDEPVLRKLGLFREEAFSAGSGHQDVTATFDPGAIL